MPQRLLDISTVPFFFFFFFYKAIGIPSGSGCGGVTGEPENHNRGSDERSCGRGIFLKKGAGMLSNYDQLCAVGYINVRLSGRLLWVNVVSYTYTVYR